MACAKLGGSEGIPHANLEPDDCGKPTLSARIPIAVVSGFLGAGKTTLVRRLLEEARHTGVKMAVVSNEFGELGIDQALLASPDDNYVELDGGCVCCRLSDDLIATLQQLRDRARPDWIVVETSGVALPYEVQMNLWRPPVSDWSGDDVAVVLVDAEQLEQGVDRDATFGHQVSSADLLVLNKTDLVPAERLAVHEATLRSIEPDAPILYAQHADVSADLLFPPDPEGLRARRREEARAPAPHSHTEYSTEVLEVPAGAEWEDLSTRLVQLGALRVKGFVETRDGLHLVQGVGARLECNPVEEVPPPQLVGRLVVIQRGSPARS